MNCAGPRVAIDAVGNCHSGGAVVLSQLGEAVSSASDQLEGVIWRSRHDCDDARSDVVGGLRYVSVRYAAGAAGRVYWALVGVNRELRRARFDVFLGMNGIGPTFRNRPPSVVFVQQSLPYCGEAMQACRVGQRLRMRVIRWITKRSVRAATHVIVQTYSMKEALSRYCGLSDGQVSVMTPSAPEFPTPSLRPRFWPTASAPIILYVGNAERYKNVGVCVAGSKIIQKCVAAQFVATIQENSSPKSEGVIALGRLSRGELKWAYEHASLLVMPSLTESLGLPLLEGMRLGTPILAADRPYAHDVCGDAATYFDPHSPDDFARKAERLLRDPDLRARQVARGREIVAALDVADPYRAMIEKTIEVARAARLASSARNLHGRSFTS